MKLPEISQTMKDMAREMEKVTILDYVHIFITVALKGTLPGWLGARTS